MKRTAGGRVVTVTVSYRLPLPVYEQATARAYNRGKRLSQILREATIRGLRAEQPLEDGRKRNG